MLEMAPVQHDPIRYVQSFDLIKSFLALLHFKMNTTTPKIRHRFTKACVVINEQLQKKSETKQSLFLSSNYSHQCYIDISYSIYCKWAI